MNADAKGLYELMVREYGSHNNWELALAGTKWVMDLDHYRQARAMADLPGDSDPEEWTPNPEDRMFGLPIEVRDNGGPPHIEGWQS